jgi:hypothetical protein
VIYAQNVLDIKTSLDKKPFLHTSSLVNMNNATIYSTPEPRDYSNRLKDFLKLLIYFYDEGEDNNSIWNLFIKTVFLIKLPGTLDVWSEVVLNLTPAVVYLVLDKSINKLSPSSSFVGDNLFSGSFVPNNSVHLPRCR